MDLNKEAEDFLKSNNVVGMTELICPIIIDFATNSKYVQAKVLQSQIDVLEKLYKDMSCNEFHNPYISDRLEEFKAQLKQLTNA